MNGAILPFTFYCRNAQLCLTKALDARKLDLAAEELQHLKAFIILVSETIPSHPNYHNRQEDKQVLQLHASLKEAAKRISDLEGECVDTTLSRLQPTKNGRHRNRQSKPQVDSSKTSKSAAKTAVERLPHCDSSSNLSSSSESMTKAQRSVRIAGASRSPSRVQVGKEQRWDLNWSLNMQETYGTVLAKHGTPPRPNVPIQRPKDSKPPLPHPQNGKEVIKSQGLLHSAAGDLMPYQPKGRDASRMRGGGTTGSSHGRSGSTGTHSSKVKNVDISPHESIHETPSYVKSSNGHEDAENGCKDHGCRLESTEGSQEVVLVKSCTHVISKHKLARHGTTSADRDGSEEGSSNVGAVDTNQMDEKPTCNEIGKGKSRSSRTSYSEESYASDGMDHGHRRRRTQYEDEQRQGSRGNGLREWKGEFVRKSERIQIAQDECETVWGSSARASLSKPRLDVLGSTDSRPASAPRRTQGIMVDRNQNETGENVDEVDVNDREARVFMATSFKREKLAIMTPETQRVMKEDCEHFRREMRLLKEKANDSRFRGEEVEGIAEKLHCGLVDGMDLAAEDTGRLKHNRNRSPRNNRDKGSFPVHHGNISDSPSVKRLRGGHPRDCSYPNSTEMQETVSSGARPLHKSPPATASASTSGSSLTSLPLSHYIQKLKQLTPDSQLGTANLELLTAVNKASGNGHPNEQDPIMKFTPQDTGALPTPNEWGHGLGHLSVTTTTSGGSASEILLPASTSFSSSHGLPRPPPRILSSRFGHSTPSTLYTSLAHPSQLQSTTNFRPAQSDSSSIAMLNGNSDPHFVAHLQEDGKPPPMVTPFTDQLCPQLQSNCEDVTDDKLSNIQRLLGELKSSVEGMMIRLEVDGQGWRARVEELEKEIESLKEEADDEILAAKHSLRNEVKVKLGDLMAEMEKIRRQERDEVEMMVEERIEKKLQGRKDNSGSVEMQDEIRLLWAEVEALTKSREEMQGHVEHLTSVAQKAQEHTNREHDMLKSENGYLRKQLQSLKNEGVQVRLETEDFRVEREDLKQAVEKLRGDGTDMKLELQGLKKVEKLMKLELENLRTGLGKLQEETQELERRKGTSQIEGGRERLLIMERVESLSQLYLGGLEEVRADVFHVKFNCRDRIQEFEHQWNEFKNQQPEGSTVASKQMLLDELDHFRVEIAEMVEIERGLLRQTLERESEAVQRQVKDLLSTSKGEIVTALKLEVQKWLQGTHEKVSLMNEALKQDLDTLKFELSRTQEGAENLMRVISAAEIQRDVAAAAAADASMSATKASNILTDVTTTINNEMTNTRQKIAHFQENLAVENDVLASVMFEARKVGQELQKEKESAIIIVQEARQKNQELQDYLQRESSKLMTAMIVVQRERDTASQAASEASSSAVKAGEVLAEILGNFNLEMTSARHISVQLQTEETLSGLARAVKELQGYREQYTEEKKKRTVLKQQKYEQKEKIWTGEISQLNQIVRVSEKRVQDACADCTEVRKKMKKFEGTQMDLVQKVEEVSSNASELANTISSWLPRYDTAARVVNDISIKVDRIEEKFEGFSCEEGLMQRISRVAEAKVEGLKELVSSSGAVKDIGLELRDLHERVESSDRAHCQAIGEVASRVTVLEHAVSRGPGQPVPGLSLKVEYTDSAEARKHGMGSLSQSVEALESNRCRKMEMMTEHTGTIVGGHESAIDSRLLGLESRIEHVASATFTNLRLLDSKVDRVSVGMQAAVEGAALAESKCGALGAELVKVFRMLTACKNPNTSGSCTNRQQSSNSTRRGRSHSPPTQSVDPQVDSRSQSPRNRSTTFTMSRGTHRGIFSPSRRSRLYISPNRPKTVPGPKRGGLRSLTRSGEVDYPKGSRDQAEGESAYSGVSEEGSSPNKQSCFYLRTSVQDPAQGCKLHTQGTILAVHERPQSDQHPQLDPLERHQDGSGKSDRQKAAIRLEAGRIHVNVSHPSAVVSQSEKRENLIAVQ